MRAFLRYISAPLILIVAMFAFIWIWRFFDLPSLVEITELAKNSFEEYGYWVLFIGALAEGLLLANWYLPGSVVVVMGVVFAQQNGLNPFVSIAIITLAFLITAVFNYALGKYGWYRLLLRFGLKDVIEKTKARVQRHGLKIIFGTYFHPNVGALTAASIGILQLPFKRFFWYSLVALCAWNTVWGAVAYFSGPAILKIVTLQMAIYALVFWLIVLSVAFALQKYKKRKKTDGAQERS